jgi:hypothetical protein
LEEINETVKDTKDIKEAMANTTLLVFSIIHKEVYSKDYKAALERLTVLRESIRQLEFVLEDEINKVKIIEGS